MKRTHSGHRADAKRTRREQIQCGRGLKPATGKLLMPRSFDAGGSERLPVYRGYFMLQMPRAIAAAVVFLLRVPGAAQSLPLPSRVRCAR